ncbi:type II toxin-antitoxin system HicA family toxin [bacterium]|nr:type II toxin-antitoxin system HicA family toxin [bacterium]
MTPRQLLRALRKAGFEVDYQQGSHISLVHPERPELTVTVPYHNKDLKKGTLKSILHQADMSTDVLNSFL